MKFISITITAIVLFLTSCSSPSSNNNNLAIKNIECDIEGMTCQGCEMTISTRLEKIDGIKVSSIDHNSGKAIITLSKEIVPIEDIKKTISDAGYNCTKVSELTSKETDSIQ